MKLPEHEIGSLTLTLCYYVAGAVLVWTIFYFEVKHIRKLSSLYGFVVISI